MELFDNSLEHTEYAESEVRELLDSTPDVDSKDWSAVCVSLLASCKESCKDSCTSSYKNGKGCSESCQEGCSPACKDGCKESRK